VQIMEENLNEFNDQGFDTPLLLGGAALTRSHCEGNLRPKYNGHVYYGLDAFEGLRLMDHITGDEEQSLNQEIDERLEKRAETDRKIEAKEKEREAEKGEEAKAELTEAEGGTMTATKKKSDVAAVANPPEPPFWGSRLVEWIDPDQIFPFINKIALFRGQWQFKKGKLSEKEYQALLEDKVEPVFERLKQKCKDEKILQPQLVYGYFPCQSDDDDLIIYDPENHDKEIERFSFPRQSEKKKLMCISDFFKSVDSGEKDVVGFTCVTMGQHISQVTQELFQNNDYQEYLYMHGMGVESAEGLAEMWHKRMRQELGVDAEDASDIRKLFQQHYRGSRYSFGYPACPDMSDQEKLFRLIEPGRIGCELTDNWQIDPEQSTSAVVVHHPQAKYFNI